MIPEKKSFFQLLLVSCVILAGCASSEDIGRLQYDLINLRSEVRGLKKSGGGEVEKRLNALEEEQKATGTAVSDLFMKVQSLTGEFQVLMGRIEEARYFSETRSRESEEKKNDLVLQLQELEASVAELEKRLASSGTVSAGAKNEEGQKEPVQDAGQQPGRGEKEPAQLIKEEYMSAYGAFKDGRFSEAREQFQSLLKDYPENEYSDNARFWIAECFYKEKNYEEAILAYEELLKKNPKSEKVPGALMKQGLAFYELNDPETGKIILEKVITDFPDSEQAGIARKKLHPSAPAKKNL